jgi:hypothetical protein
LKANAISCAVQTRAGLSVPSKTVKLPVAKLLAAMQLTKTGERRWTKYLVGVAVPPNPGRVSPEKESGGHGFRAAAKE